MTRRPHRRRRGPGAPAAPFACVLLWAGCAGTVGQHDNSGPDYRPDGAEVIELEGGEGSAVGIVTYPGGDRVDWKKVEIPEDFAGTLQWRLLFNPPRDGLDVTFEVYDETFERVAVGDPPPGSGARVVEAEVMPALGGTYYVHIYAPERGDAGEYQIAVRTRPGDVSEHLEQGDDPRIPDPPTLPAIPENGDATVAQQENGGGEPSTGGPVGGGETTDPDPDEDEEPAEALEPVAGRVVGYQLGGDGSVNLTVNRGTNDGVERGWTGQMMVGSSERPLRGGRFTVRRATAGESLGQVNVSVDQLRANRRVLLLPPGYEED